MDELLAAETRSRSRSKTPFLRSSCDREQCTHTGDDEHEHHHHKKSPILNKKHKQIATIIEEEVDSKRPQSPSKRQPVRSTTKISTARTTSDYSSNSSEDLSTNADATPTPSEIATQIAFKNHKENQGNIERATRSTTVTTTKVTRSIITNGRSSVNHQANKSKEILQNESNSAFEENIKIKTSTPIMSGNQMNQKKKNVFVGTSFDGGNSDLNHAGYKEYHNAGEYWTKYPKTDYVYSEFSPFRRELAPGAVAFPNMSRKSLENYNDRINSMIAKNPDRADSIRKRFIQTLFTKKHRNDEYNDKNQLLYDSQDETDFNDHDNVVKRESLFYRFYLRIISIFSTITSIFSRSSQSEHSLRSRTPIHQSHQGFFMRSNNFVTSAIYSLFTSIYLLISSVLYLDTWLLRSSNPDGRKKKFFLLFLLMLLPLLLLAAWKLLTEHERQLFLSRYMNLIPFSLIGLRNSLANFKSGMSTFSFDLSWPTLPAIKFVDDSSYSTITNNIQKSLSAEEYDNLLNHINVYVQKTVDNRLNVDRQKRDTTLSPDISTLIVNLVQDQIHLHQTELNTKSEQLHGAAAYKLTNEDIENIIAQLQVRLQALKYSGPIVFSKENIDEITKLIEQNIYINNEHFNVIEKLDINAVLMRILESPRLADFVDARIKLHQSANEPIQAKIEAGLLMASKERDTLANQQRLIDELNSEITYIKTSLTEKLKENKDLHYSISLLQNAQNEITDRMQMNEINVNGRFDSLLADIEQRLASLNTKQFDSINRQIKLNLIEILGYRTAEDNREINLDEIDLKNWIRNMFVAKAVLEERLNELSLKYDQNIRDQIDKSGVILFKDISEKLKVEIMKAVEQRQREMADAASNQATVNLKASDLNEEEIRRIVRSVLAVYDADKTGMVDFALESAGGQVLSTRCTENYQVKSAQISLFGFPLWYPSNTPRTAISPSVQPGECWAFQGFPGFLVLKLNTMIYVSGFSLEHIPKSLAPSGNIDSAPKNFTVWGLNRENDEEPVLFGEYEYSDEAASLQYFKVQNKDIDRPYDIVELRIETNHGSLAYTCLYRFRVHGKTTKT